MVRIIALLLALLPTPALAQATFTTVISPSTLGTSPLAVTFGVSPFGVICVAGCASAGASPSSVIVTNVPTVSLWTSPAVVSITGVTQVAAAANIPVVQATATSPWGIAGTVAITGGVSLSTSAPYVNINTIPTVTTSAVAGVTAVNINNTPTVSLSTSAPFVQQGTATWTVNLPTSPITVGTMTSGAVTNVMAAGTSALAVTPIISPVAVIVTSSFTNVVSPLATIVTSLPFVTLTTSPTPVVATSAAVTNVMAAGTSPLAVTLTSSPTAIAEQNGNAYPNRANWLTSSLSTASTGNQVLMNAPAANKLYITGLNCARSDTGGQMMTLAFNITLKNGTSFYMVVPPLSGSAQTNMSFQTPLQVAATTSLQFTPNISVAALLCNAEGYNAP